MRTGLFRAGTLLGLLLAAGSVARAQDRPPEKGPTAADGKVFRILDRAAKEISRNVVFSGLVPGSVAVNRNADGTLAICLNNLAGPPEESAKPGSQAPAPQAPVKPKGTVLLCDLTSLYNPRFVDGRFVYANDGGYDEDDREYELFPAAGPDSRTFAVGRLLFLTGAPPAAPTPKVPDELPLQVVLKRWGGAYLAPIGGSQVPPAKVAESDPAFKEAKDLAKARFDEEPAWGDGLKPSWVFRGGAEQNPLLDAVTLFASDGEQFLMVVDLRKLESKDATYFWAPYDLHRSVHLDRHVLSVLGVEPETPDSYQPTTYVEYPYLVVVGEYAKLSLASPSGKSEVTLAVGSCP